MKKPKKKTVVLILAFAAMMLISYIELNILSLSVYILLLTYVLIIFSAAFVYRTNLMAVLGNFYYMTGKEDKALALLKASVEKKTKSPVAHLNYAIMLVRDGNHEEAMISLRKASALKPNIMTQKNIMLTMGSCYWVKGEIDEAIETLELMRKKFEYVNQHVLSTLGYFYIIKGDYDKAREMTEKALAEAPESYAAWDNIGQIAFNRNDMQKAKEAFEKALSYKESLVDSLYFMGVIYEEEGDTEKAGQYFERAKSAEITALNTVTKQQVQEKYEKYFDFEAKPQS